MSHLILDRRTGQVFAVENLYASRGQADLTADARLRISRAITGTGQPDYGPQHRRAFVAGSYRFIPGHRRVPFGGHR